MPIYAYKCESCGFAKDVLQKMSDLPLSACPQCGGSTFKKQLTAAGFQLKGSGWYVTDFKDGNTKSPAAKPDAAPAADAAEAGKALSDTSSSPAAANASTVAAPAGATTPISTSGDGGNSTKGSIGPAKST